MSFTSISASIESLDDPASRQQPQPHHQNPNTAHTPPPSLASFFCHSMISSDWYQPSLSGDQWSQDFGAFVGLCGRRDAASRPSCSELLGHGFVSGVDGDPLMVRIKRYLKDQQRKGSRSKLLGWPGKRRGRPTGGGDENVAKAEPLSSDGNPIRSTFDSSGNRKVKSPIPWGEFDDQQDLGAMQVTKLPPRVVPLEDSDLDEGDAQENELQTHQPRQAAQHPASETSPLLPNSEPNDSTNQPPCCICC
eukprot:m.62817 g.62817  ORF g.62817 m.62817 type:complete len:249 (+) comp13385_c0_seq1:971-1717(+)